MIKIKRIKPHTISMLWLIISILYCFYGDKYIGLFVSIWEGGAILIIIFYYKQIKYYLIPCWTESHVRRDGNDSNLLIVFYVQIMPDDFVMQLHRF